MKLGNEFKRYFFSILDLLETQCEKCKILLSHFQQKFHEITFRESKILIFSHYLDSLVNGYFIFCLVGLMKKFRENILHIFTQQNDEKL